MRLSAFGARIVRHFFSTRSQVFCQELPGTLIIIGTLVSSHLHAADENGDALAEQVTKRYSGSGLYTLSRHH